MSSRAYSEINLHIVWHVKDNVRVLNGDIERFLQKHIETRVRETPGARLHAVGGTDDHVHLAVSVPPELSVSNWIGEIKGAGAYYINHRVANQKALEWQAGYGVVSFGTRSLPWVVGYVREQRQHHAKGTSRSRLERSTADEPQRCWRA